METPCNDLYILRSKNATILLRRVSGDSSAKPARLPICTLKCENAAICTMKNIFGKRKSKRGNPPNRKHPPEQRHSLHKTFRNNSYKSSTPPFHQGQKRNPNPNFLVRIFSGGVGVFHGKGWGPKSSVCPSKPGKVKLFERDIPGFCRDILEVPEMFEKKNLRSILASYFIKTTPHFFFNYYIHSLIFSN